MWLLEPALPVIAAGVAGMIAWRQETRRLHRRALHEPWNADMSGEDYRRDVFSQRKRHRWSVTVLSAVGGSVAAAVMVQFIHVAQVARGG
jgi:hypothetical protein